MKHLLLPSICAVLLAGCDPAERLAKVNAADSTPSPATNPAAGASLGTAQAPLPATNPVVAPKMEVANSIPLAAPKPPPDLPPAAQDVIRLSQTAVDPSVVLGFIESIREPFSLNADQIIYLSDLGLGTPVINGLLKKANNPPSGGAVQRVFVQAPGASAAQPATASQPEPAREPAPAGNVILTNYLASTGGGGLPNGIPGAPLPASPAPIYGDAQPGPATATVQPVAPAQPVTYNTFHESLSPYGSWIQIQPYGWCWQPTVVNLAPTWRPYCDGGQWLWTDQGWYWHSTYSWGWAPFHYGRWHRSTSVGWVWAPGTDWAPAWVSWRRNDAYCGWAPLPPECHWSAGVGFSWFSGGTRVSVGFGIWDDCWYATSWNRFCDPYPSRWRMDRRDIPGFVRNSRQAIGGDNSVNIVGNNNTVIINNGIPRDDVQRHTRDEIRKYAVNDAQTPERAAQRVATSSAVARPEVAAFRPRIQNSPGIAGAPPASVLARQESRKASPSPTGTSGFVPSRPGSDSGNLPSPTPGRSTPPAGSRLISAGTQAHPDTGIPARTPGKTSEPANRPATTGSLTPAPSVRPPLPARSVPGADGTRPGVTPARPGTGSLPTPSPTPANGSPGIISRPANSPVRPVPAPPAAPATPSRRPESQLSAPIYQQPGYSTPAGRPTPVPTPSLPSRTAPSAAPGNNPGAVFRPEPSAPREFPSARSEMRKPEPSFRSYSPPANGPAFNSPNQASALDSGRRAQPAPNFQSPRMNAPSPAPRSEPRQMGPQTPSAPAPRSPQPAGPASGGGFRPTPSRGGSPVE